MRLKTFLMPLMVLLCLSGCSAFDWMVYKIDIPQGNYVDSKQVERLRVQMSKEQVRFVLGPPMLVDTFQPNHWYYIYSYQNGNGPLERKDLIAVFEQGKLVQIEGDYQPSAGFMQPLDAI